MSFNEYMSQFVDIEEIKAVFLIALIFIVSYAISKVIMYYADKYYSKVIEPTFNKYKRGEELSEKEKQIIERYKV